MNNNNVVQIKSYNFSLRIVKMYEYLSKEKQEYILSKQAFKTGTSIGANVAEAHGGISKAGFSAKISIAYKEALETKYWIDLLHNGGYINKIFTTLH